MQKEHWNVLWLDHDLGEDKTGYDIICWIEENDFTGSIKKPEIIICVSSNPVGRNKINSAIKRMYGLIFDERHVIALESQLKTKE